MKKIFKYFKWVIVSVLSLLFIYAIVALILSSISTSPEEHKCYKNYKCYVATNGVHLFVILPVENLNHELISNLNINSDVSYISFGWGERNFYLNTPEWNDLTLPVALNALFIPSKSAMHVYYYTFDNAQSHWNGLDLCEIQLSKLNEFVNSHFQTSFGNFVEIENAGYTEYDKFYEAKGKYTCFYTSNQWVCDALKEAEVKTAIWSPFDFGVLWHIK